VQTLHYSEGLRTGQVASAILRFAVQRLMFSSIVILIAISSLMA
jgi:hypothetical protein